MIGKFISEKRSWIIMFLFLQAFSLIVAALDETIAFTSVLYTVFLSSLIFLLFLFWRYQKETPFYKSLTEREDKAMRGSLTYEWLRIHHLLDQQLHSKRLPFMQNDLYIEKISIEPLLYDEIRTLQTWCIQKGIGFEVELSESEVLTDSKWLSFILRQLLTNAVKYSEASDIVITSSIQYDQVCLQIKDFGIGIAKQDLSRIYEKGFTSTANRRSM